MWFSTSFPVACWRSKDTPLALIHSTEIVSWSKSNETGMFVEDQSGSISPVKAPGLVFGVDHDVTYTFQPHNPYLACLPCQDMARVNADKIQCEGGTSVRSLPGYMVLHAAGWMCSNFSGYSEFFKCTNPVAFCSKHRVGWN